LTTLALAGAISHSGWLYDPALRGAIRSSSAFWNYAGFALFGLAVGLACAMAGRRTALDFRAVLQIASAAVLAEAALLLYLPANLALTQYRVGPMLDVAAWIGIWGVSWTLWLANAGMALGLCRAPRLSVLTIALVVIAAYGLPTRPSPARSAPPGMSSLRVAAVQGWHPTLAHYRTQLQAAGRAGVDLVVWPELSAPAGDLAALAREPGVPAFITTGHDAQIPLPHNAATLYSAQGPSAPYHKRRPFGAEPIKPGSAPLVVALGELRVGLNICFDSCFPLVIRDTARLGCDLIALPTLDPRGPHATIQALHAAYTPFRAAENGVPILRAEETAFSLVTDASGRIVAELGVGEGLLVANIVPGQHPTWQLRIGDGWLLVAAVLWLGTYVVRRRVAREHC
jgi:apolipoprotein N-acyltransferase